MKYEKIKIDLDLSCLLKVIGSIIENEDLELVLIRTYSKIPKKDTLKNFNNLVLAKLYKDTELKDRPYSEINNFFIEKHYLNKIYLVLDTITTIVNRTVGPDYIDAECNLIKKHTDTELIAEFIITKRKE